MTRRRYLALLAIVFAGVWTLLAISPSDRADWALENVLAVVAVVLILLTSSSSATSPANGSTVCA